MRQDMCHLCCWKLQNGVVEALIITTNQHGDKIIAGRPVSPRGRM